MARRAMIISTGNGGNGCMCRRTNHTRRLHRYSAPQGWHCGAHHDIPGMSRPDGIVNWRIEETNGVTGVVPAIRYFL